MLGQGHSYSIFVTDQVVPDKYVIDGGKPTKGFQVPKNFDEACGVVTEAYNAREVFVPVGGGTRLEVGRPLSKYDIALDISYLNDVISYNPDDLTCTVQSVITLAALQDNLREYNQFLAIDAPEPDIATIGGTLATSAPGYVRWNLDHMRDTVIGMKVIMPNGMAVKTGGQTVKNVSGYDMARLHIGAFGSLGVIGEVSFKLTPIPSKLGSMCVTFGKFENAHIFSMNVFDGYVMPLALACFDSCGASRIGIQAKSDKWTVLIKIGSRERAFDRQMAIIRELSLRNSSESIEFITQEEGIPLWNDLRDFGSSDGDRLGAPSTIGRVYLTPSQVKGCEENIRRILLDSPVPFSIISQPGFGTLVVYIFGGDIDEVSKLTGALNEIRLSVNRVSGELTFERLPIQMKNSVEVWDEIRSNGKSIMNDLARVYDDRDIINRGRLWYSLK